mmetsp:Transcript_20631/g.28548  ORF Transcript_20631/g.28548 Transcript_20631/m.28548 type:complete len:160 (-) Transcript_20631:19-498(-)
MPDGALALMPEGNSSGSWWFWTLGTRKYVTRNHWTEMPMPNEVIAHINSIANKYKLKISKDVKVQWGTNKADVVNDDSENTDDNVALPGMDPPMRNTPQQHIAQSPVPLVAQQQLAEQLVDTAQTERVVVESDSVRPRIQQESKEQMGEQATCRCTTSM